MSPHLCRFPMQPQCNTPQCQKRILAKYRLYAVVTTSASLPLLALVYFLFSFIVSLKLFLVSFELFCRLTGHYNVLIEKLSQCQNMLRIPNYVFPSQTCKSWHIIDITSILLCITNWHTVICFPTKLLQVEPEIKTGHRFFFFLHRYRNLLLSGPIILLLWWSLWLQEASLEPR